MLVLWSTHTGSMVMEGIFVHLSIHIALHYYFDELRCVWHSELWALHPGVDTAIYLDEIGTKALRDVVLIVVYRDDLCAREVTWENT